MEALGIESQRISYVDKQSEFDDINTDTVDRVLGWQYYFLLS